MKKIMAPIVLASAFILAGVGTTVSNMNTVALLLAGSGVGSDEATTTQFQHKDDDPEGEKQYLKYQSDATMEALQSGLSGAGGTGQGGLNLLWLLQNAKDPDKGSYAYQLLEAYAKLENGSYNNLEGHITAPALAGIHFNETKLQSFAAPHSPLFGKPHSGSVIGKQINGKTITLENAMKADVPQLGIGSGPNVWKDNGGDGIPDGPYQIEKANGQPNTPDKNRAGGTVDFYNFVDNLNTIDLKFNKIYSQIEKTGAAISRPAANGIAGMVHNRGEGGAVGMLYGLPYHPSKMGASRYLKKTTIQSMDKADIEMTLGFIKDMGEWINRTNLPLEEITGDNGKGRALAVLVITANGGFISKKVAFQLASDLQSLSDRAIGAVHPGQTKKSIVGYLNANYVKKPWDVLGMSKPQYDKIYGSGSISENYEEIYRNSMGQNTVFYIDKNIKSNNYTSGEQVVVRAIEGIAAGYIIDASIGGEAILMQLAAEAGIKSLTDGTILDMTDPTTFYEKLPVNPDGGTYNPAAPADGNFGLFLDGLGLTGKLSETQQAQIQALYSISGGRYSQPGRGSIGSNGKLLTDCSFYASYGLHLGKHVSDPVPQTSAIQRGGWMTSKVKTAAVNGKEYPATVRQLDKNGKVMAERSTFDKGQSRRDVDWLPFLQTGDMVNGVGKNGGHIFTYLGKNNTKKTMVLTQDVSKVGAAASKYEPGEHFTMQSAWFLKTVRGDMMGLTHHFGDSAENPWTRYQAMRPTYNITN